MSSVLIVDNEPDLLDLVAWKLVGAGHTVHTAGDGVTALRLAEAVVPDVVLLDVAMPGLSGLEVCRALRSGPRTADVPVLLLSARAEEHDIEAGLAAGAAEYLTKPFSPRALARTVDRLIRTRQARLAAAAARAAAASTLTAATTPPPATLPSAITLPSGRTEIRAA